MIVLIIIKSLVKINDRIWKLVLSIIFNGLGVIYGRLVENEFMFNVLIKNLKI